MSINVFNDSANIGPILDNIKNTIVATESMLTLDVDDTITPVPISAYGKTLLDSTSLGDLRSQLLENTNEEAIRLLSDGNSEINMYTSGTGASQLRLQITDSNTKINNNLLTDNIKDLAGNQSVNITSAQLTLQRPKITFRDSAYTNRGYTQAQNSGDYDGDNTTGYLEWYTGLNARCAYMGLGGSNDLFGYNGKSISLALEQGCNFRIAEGAVEIFKVSVEDDIITANYEFNINVTAADNTFALYKCPAGEQVSIYSHSGLSEGFLLQKGGYDDGVKINMYHNGAYRPIYLNSANSGKLVIGTENVQADAEKFIVTSTSRFKDYVVADDLIKLNGPNNSGALYCKGDANPLNTNADNISLNYNITLNKATNVESVILPAEKTAKIEMNQFAIQLQMSSTANSLPSTIFEASHLFVTTFKNIVPNANNILDIGIDDGSTLSRFRDCYLTRNLDITGTSSRVIMTDSSVADNTIRSSGVCGNTIVGVKSQTSDTGVGFLRLAAGIETTQQINETYIDLYGANSTDTYQSIRHIVNNSEMFVIDTTTAEFKTTLFTQNIFPSSAPTVSPHTASLYDIGTDVTRYRDIYLRDAPTHGSDMRLKKNIVPLQNSLNTVLKLKPKLFQWISSASGRNHIGFIAQDIEKIPELAETGYFCKSKDGSTMSLRSCELIPVLSGAIQDLYGLLTSSTDKPIIIKEQVKSVEEHKCNNLELINSLNSYEVKLTELDSSFEELCDENSILKVKNNGLEKRVTELELLEKVNQKHIKSLTEKLEKLENQKQDDLLTEDDENNSVMDLMNKRFLELEARLLKTEKKNAKLVTTINKMLKEK